MFYDASAFDQDLGWCVDDGVDPGDGAPFKTSRHPVRPTSCGVMQCTTSPTARQPTSKYWGNGHGWCMSGLDELIGITSDANACWTMCEDEYGPASWPSTGPPASATARDDCQCMEDHCDAGNLPCHARLFRSASRTIAQAMQ